MVTVGWWKGPSTIVEREPGKQIPLCPHLSTKYGQTSIAAACRVMQVCFSKKHDQNEA